MTKDKFEWIPFLKKLAAIGVPVALQNLLSTTASMVDTMMVAPLGKLTVGALGLCAQFSTLMFSCYWGFVGGGMLFFAQYYGAEDDDGIDRSFGMTIACMMTVSIIFGAMALLFPYKVMSIYTDKETIRQIGVQYLSIVGVAYVFQVYSVGASALLRSTERVKIPLIASIASVSTNLFLNWVLIYGHLGVKAMGIRGAALATTIAAFVNASVTLILAKAKGYPYLFQFARHFKWDRASVKVYFVKCFPIMCNEFFLGFGNMIFNITLGRQSEEFIAALAVFRTLEGLIIGFFAGFSNASSVLVGTQVGAGELRTAYERAKRIIYLCSAFIGLTGIVLMSLSQPILKVMSLNGESLEIGTRILAIYLVIAIIRMGNWIQNDTYRAAGDAITGTVLEIVFMYLMLVPAVLLSGFVFKSPYWVVFLCCYIDEPIRYVLMQIHLYSGKWIRPVTQEGKAKLEEFMNWRKEARLLRRA